ncbi:hypothetical protein FB45DRAFT_913126 [Roridomyces roridus]|uniref:Vacuolar sorting protein 39/Transforming growth factor beta receptor-associated domain-containing protein n=1 Tax=Roridomyces roridus TaxID=1738132 RepID=A0AAD7BWN5_9AGAR|nr:hypothetical protein FB45DRAFT_913126 [Roridomyces roridus]
MMFPKSNVLLLGSSVQSLVPSTLISQADSLLDSHRIEEAVDLADQQRKKLQGNVTVDEDEAEELRYVYQRIGFQCFTETLFEDAGKNLFNGDLDPRVLVSYFPELRGSLFNPSDTIDLYAGVAERMPSEASVDQIIVANIVRNYSPYLKPNTQTAPPTAELRRILGMSSVDMLEVFLRKCRTRRIVEGKRKADASYPVVDTVLAKIYAQAETTKELYSLIQETPHFIVLAEIAPVLKQTGQYNALCMLYKQAGDDEKLLELWARLIEGEWTDDDIPDPTQDMLSLLINSRNRTLTQKWGLWLTRRDPERGMKLLMPRETGKRPQRPEEDISLLEQIREANPIAGAQFLEYLVLQKRSLSRDLHTQLATVCLDQVFAALEDKDISKLWRAKASSYAKHSATTTTFFSYFASTTPDSPSKLSRLKTILFLHGSSLYDAELIRERLAQQPILCLELAIVDGKLGNHRAALSTLVNDLHDDLSAEAYCALGGDVVPDKVAQAICADATLGLGLWTFGATGKGRQKTMDTNNDVATSKKQELLKILLELYMSKESASAEHVAHLVNSQAMNLDVVDVIPMVPPQWPLKVMSSFLARSFRRTVHARQEGRIVKALSVGQNLDVKDRSWLILREEGMVVEEALDGDGDGAGVDFDEKGGIIEKVIASSPAGQEKTVIPWTSELDAEPTI